MTHPGVDLMIVDNVGVRVASVGGVLDVFSAGVVGARVLANLPADTHAIVVDLDGIEFMDTAGVSALLRLREHAVHRSVELHARMGALPQLNPTVTAVLHRLLDSDDEAAVDLRQEGDEPASRTSVSSTG